MSQVTEATNVNDVNKIREIRKVPVLPRIVLWNFLIEPTSVLLLASLSSDDQKVSKVPHIKSAATYVQLIK